MYFVTLANGAGTTTVEATGVDVVDGALVFERIHTPPEGEGAPYAYVYTALAGGTWERVLWVSETGDDCDGPRPAQVAG